MLNSDVPCRKPVENTLPTGTKVQICYTPGERRGFSLSDRYNVRSFSGNYSAVTHKRAKFREMRTRERCLQNVNIQFVYSVSLTDIVGHPVCKKFQPWARSVNCFPTAVRGTSWQTIVDGPRWKRVDTLASRNSRTTAAFYPSIEKALVRGGF